MKDIRALRPIMRGALIAVLALMLIAEGAVRQEPLHLLSAVAFAIASISLLLLDRRPGAFSPVVISLGMALLLAAWGLFQSGFDFGWVRPHPVWRSASEIIGPLTGAISIAPSDTLEAIIPVTLPFVIFASCYIVFDSDRSVTMLMGTGVAIAVLGAVLAILQLEFAPDTLLFGPKRYYLDSLTAFFVNRNTGATYLAMQMIVAAAFCLKYAGNFDIRRLLGTEPAATVHGRRPGRSGLDYVLPMSVVATAILFTALMLTKSRAGAAAGLIGLAAFMLLAAYHGAYRRRPRSAIRSSARKTSTGRRLARMILVLVALALVAGTFAGRAVLRAETRGVDDERFCLYPGMVRLLQDNWQFGTGFGTFKDAFSPYRPPECEVLSIIDRAHSFYLEALITAGVIVVPLMLIAVFYLLFAVIRGIRLRKSMRWVPMAGLGVLFTVILHSTVDFSIQIPGLAVWFAAIMAGVVRVSFERQ